MELFKNAERWLPKQLSKVLIFHFTNENSVILFTYKKNATGNFKTVYSWNYDWSKDEAQSPHMIADCQETKTTWHPIENIAGVGSGY